MAKSLNKVMLIGNLGKDPELRYTTSGVAIATFSLATNEQWKDQDGNAQERTEWHNIVAWKKLAEICGEWLKKGKKIYVEGRIQSRRPVRAALHAGDARNAAAIPAAPGPRLFPRRSSAGSVSR